MHDQITVQARDMGESRYLYDQLAVLAPIMMALSAATPIHKVCMWGMGVMFVGEGQRTEAGHG